MPETVTQCKTCEHCDTDEATTFYAPGSVVRHVVVGVCTLRLGFFHAKPVPDWLTACPDYDARWEETVP